jgi:hypothetical protein
MRAVCLAFRKRYMDPADREAGAESAPEGARFSISSALIEKESSDGHPVMAAFINCSGPTKATGAELTVWTSSLTTNSKRVGTQQPDIMLSGPSR